MTNTRQLGFGIFGLLLVSATLGIIGLAGWSVYNVRKNYDPTQQVDTTKTQMTNYENTEFGFSFSYPAVWGAVQKVTPGSVPGASDPKLLYSGTFNMNKDTVFTLAPKDYVIPKQTIGDGRCFYHGFGAFNYLLAETDADDYSITEVVRNPDRQIIEEYKNGYCTGKRLRGRISLPLAQTNGVDLTYFAPGQPEYDDETKELLTIKDYMNIRSNLVTEAQKQQFIQTVLSFKIL